jgi:adenine-specific DNA-methyltransferase
MEDAASQILTKLSTDSSKLDNTEIQQGLVTPQHFLIAQVISKLDNPESHKAGEGIFVLRKAEVNKLKLTRHEQRLLRPFHYAEEIDSYYYRPDAEHYLIYTPIEVAKDIESNPDKYPNIRSHLDKYQPIITSDHKPYGIHRARQPEWFEDSKKIVCVRKTKYPKFVVIPEPWYGDQAVLIIRLTKHAGISPHFVAAILNSKVAHFWLFQQKRQGNQLQVDKEVLLHFPFRKLDLSKSIDKEIYDYIVALAAKVSEQKKELELVKSSSEDIFGEKSRELQQTVQKTKREIDQVAFGLYGLTEEEIKQIENVAGKE